MIGNQEAILHEQVANYIRHQYPGVMFHFDMAGVNLDKPWARAQFSRLNGRAWPDLFIASSGGLFLELKKEGTKVFKRDGTLCANIHLQEQAAALEGLRASGYKAEFAIGFDQAKETIDNYLNNEGA